MTNHEIYIRRCFQLAQLGAGQVSPNPMVGSVLVYNDTIIGEGYHQQYGMAHAEVNCLDSVSPENRKYISQSTLYVNLEPCNHFGKTPPCVDLILKNEIKRVVVSNVDPFEKVAGKGIERLRANDVQIISGVLEEEGKQLNKMFFTSINKQRPYILLKWAESQDGFIAPTHTHSYWISSPESRIYVHKLRAEYDAILIGKNTLLSDNPSLTTRFYNGKNPLRIVLSNANIENKQDFACFDSTAETIVSKEVSDDNSIESLLKYLHNRNIRSIIVEGGRAVLQQFIDLELYDEIIIIKSNTIQLGEGLQAPLWNTSNCKSKLPLGTDWIYFF